MRKKIAFDYLKYGFMFIFYFVVFFIMAFYIVGDMRFILTRWFPNLFADPRIFTVILILIALLLPLIGMAALAAQNPLWVNAAAPASIAVKSWRPRH